MMAKVDETNRWEKAVKMKASESKHVGAGNDDGSK